MLPLHNRRILITRSPHQASDLAARLEALGAATILIPTIAIAPPESWLALDRALARLRSYNWLLFTSANAVESFHRRRGTVETVAKIAVIGPATARAAEKIGLKVALIPPQAVAESLSEALIPHLTPGSRILLVRATTARDHLPEALAAAGAQVTIAEAYKTIIPPESIAALQHLFADPARHPHAITFTSSSTATNLLTLLDAAALTLPRNILRASIGPITSQTLRDHHHPPHLESPEATIPSLAEMLRLHFVRQNVLLTASE